MPNWLDSGWGVPDVREQLVDRIALFLDVDRVAQQRQREQLERVDRTSLGGVPREQKMLKGHLPRDIYHQVY